MSAISTFPYHMELIDGVEVEKPRPKNLHAFIEGYLLGLFHQALPSSHQALPELNVICGADRLVPDVTVMERMANYVDGDLADPPLLAIEILSPGQIVSSISIPLFGVISAFCIQPRSRT